MNRTMDVKTQNLVKAFAGTEIIKDLSINIPQGTIYGLLGANGAGKTTLFKLLLGFLRPTAGRAAVLGMDTATKQEEILKNIGSLIEVPVFYGHLSAHKNLEIHLAYLNSPGNIAETLDLVGLKVIGSQPVRQFSLGMRQRLGIARVIIHKPRLLILDEPINGLDPIGIREMRELFLRLKNERKMTILISSHILSEIEHIADMIGVLAKGTIVREVTMKAVKEQFPNGLEDYFYGIMEGGISIA